MNADEDRLQVRVEAPEQLGELPAAAEVAGFRIVLEALANVVRHANAHTCLIELTHRCQELRIEVGDDGIGVEASHEAGNGLASMYDLAAELGGRMEVSRREGGGTRVTAVIPTGVET